MTSIISRLSTIVLAVALVSGCGGGGGGSSRSVQIGFSAKIAGDAFACGRTFQGIGTTATTVTPQDLRFYVYGVNLTTAAGESLPVRLREDGVWQRDGLALIDFEDALGACADEGTPETNTTLRGTVKNGDYTAISFVMGVPFDMNHIDAQTALPPQNLTPMWWNWNAGFKFLKFDVSSTGFPDGWRVHLGSTGCTGNETGAVNECAKPNRVTVTLPTFNPDTQTIALELAGFLDGSNVDLNTAQTAPGCMSAPNDPECTSIFSKLGLTGDEQSLFYVE